MKVNLQKKNHHKGFTLVELLVVIGIIAVLASFTFSAVLGFIQKAKMTKTQNVMKEITLSMESFERDYGYLPYTGTGQNDDTIFKTDTGEFLKVIMGQDDTINPRSKVYFEPEDTQGKKNDGAVFDSNGKVEGLYDVWENPYHIMVDYDGDGELDTSKIYEKYPKKLRTTTPAIATPGGDSPDFNDDKDAKSWGK